MLKERRNKSFPQILGIIEQIIIANKGNVRTLAKISLIIKKILDEKFTHPDDNEYDLIWLVYFVKSLDLFKITFPVKLKSEFLKSLKANRAEFLKPIPTDFKLFETIKKPGSNLELLDHLALFKKVEDEI